MRAPANIPHQYGVAPVAISRFFALYLAQICWLVLGAFLLANAVWPSACQPTTVAKFVSCSIHLPDNRGWIESALLTWLWSTPLLIGLEISRRLNPPRRR
ncbi:MAG: hypothetical protein B7Z33_00815 [Sphingomonadales bacterium 12-68-11]|nr:MAG: hypothetical protein B7Z33_00815 [Sphingomonadales bacterium 12-68-11]OYX16941.1 MAG: hypothetical protein B7Z07_01445 [Sphingomonadales bacterium 32-67-7]